MTESAAHGERPEDGSHQQVGAVLARLAAHDAPRGRAAHREMGALSRALTVSARAAGRASVLGGRWLTDLLVDAAPRIPVRDLPTLRAQHPSLPDEDLAETLVSGAAKATAAVGAAGGALAAVEWVASPTLLTIPVQIAAETLLVAAIEVKLLAELHALYDAVPDGTPRQRAASYLVAWTNRRGLDPRDVEALKFSLGGLAKVQLRRRLVRRAGRNLSTLGPMMSGAVAGSVVNHRETRRLAEQVRADLRRRRPVRA